MTCKILIMKYTSRDFKAVVNILSEIELFIINNIRKTIQDVNQIKSYDYGSNNKIRDNDYMAKYKDKINFLKKIRLNDQNFASTITQTLMTYQNAEVLKW
ncbi:hypothetical protein DMUE_5382 [Dictyocoela muelleri]|nr:hypothetical protein DMUE_5382 [Dictyocoela muelleri]